MSSEVVSPPQPGVLEVSSDRVLVPPPEGQLSTSGFQLELKSSRLSSLLRSAFWVTVFSDASVFLCG